MIFMMISPHERRRRPTRRRNNSSASGKWSKEGNTRVGFCDDRPDKALNDRYSMNDRGNPTAGHSGQRWRRKYQTKKIFYSHLKIENWLLGEKSYALRGVFTILRHLVSQRTKKLTKLGWVNGESSRA
jgi:hypothetical protein